MGLTIGEKIGAIIAFIPIASTFSGLIKAIVYYKRTKNENNCNSEQMALTAGKTNKRGFSILSKLERGFNKKLWKASLIEILPLFNVIAAIYAVFVLQKLSTARDHIQNLNSNESKEKIFGLYGQKPFNDEKKDNLLLSIIETVNENEKHIIDFCYGVLHRNGPLPSADKLIKLARDEFEKIKPPSPKEKNEDIIHKFKEESRQRLEQIKNGTIILEVN
jgi:hypothetical protein